MEANKTHTCDCGFQWLHGHSGSHNCSPGYRKRIAELTAALASHGAPQEAQCANCEGIGHTWEPNGEKLACDLCADESPYLDASGRLKDDLRELIEGMSVSVDVSTGDNDAGHRLFGTVTIVQDDEQDKCGVTLLVQDAKPNFAAPAPAVTVDALQQTIECLQDVISHHEDFRSACGTRHIVDLEKYGGDSASYWDKQQRVLDRMKAQAELSLPAVRALVAKPSKAPTVGTIGHTYRPSQEVLDACAGAVIVQHLSAQPAQAPATCPCDPDGKHGLAIAAPAGEPVSPLASCWQVVPVLPTEEMEVAFAELWFSRSRPIDDCDMADAYAAMLAAAPVANAGQAQAFKETCPLMHDGACSNRHQCWEPCGELGKSAEHARVATQPEQLATQLTTFGAEHAIFKIGDHVRKIKGSQWQGHVVGMYSTSLTPEGYAVESSTERGSVQIYPAAALELVVE